ncbi:hypothetical protein BH10PLA1_BH10PLA1_01040 [soil metagenome]
MTTLKRLAILIENGTLCAHFGRAKEFLPCDVEPRTVKPGRTRIVIMPAKPGECE